MSPTYQTRSKTTPSMIPKTSSRTKVEDVLVVNGPSPSTPVSKKRKTNAVSSVQKGKVPVVDLTTAADFDEPSPSKKKNKTSTQKEKNEEKRLRVFRKHAPQSYLQKLDRATSQRMFVIDRTHGGTDDAPEETIEMAGTTGNIYHVRICHLPSCTCPDNRKGNQCKHIIYVLHKVLKVPEHLQYQLAFISSELRTIFAHAPSLPSSSPSSHSNRKPIAGDCPICFCDFAPATEEIVFCKAGCGNNIHKACFEQWARSTAQGVEVRCVYCRAPWQGDEESLKGVGGKGKVGQEGYVNVGVELGLSGVRDYGTYHQPWVRRELGPYY